MTQTPAIVILSAHNLDTLLAQFARYSGEYAVIPTGTAAAAGSLIRTMVEDGIPIALLVVDHPLPNEDTKRAIAQLRSVVPTARRAVVSHVNHFRESIEKLSNALSTGAIDTFLLLPRGKRDEEFHVAIGELLNDWNATVSKPVVESVRVITPVNDALTEQVLEYLNRIGAPTGVHTPDSEIGQEVLANFDGPADEYPIVAS